MLHAEGLQFGAFADQHELRWMGEGKSDGVLITALTEHDNIDALALQNPHTIS